MSIIQRTEPESRRAPSNERRTTRCPIADYGLLSDCNTAALVARDGSIDWLCLPRFDSPAVFARILDPDAGHWSITPAGGFTSERRYLDGSLVLETTFETDGGVVRLRDALVFAEGQRGHDIGLDAPHELCRSVEGVSGTVALDMELLPRPEFGLVRPLFRRTVDGGRTFGGPNQLDVRAGVPVTVAGAAMTRVVLRGRRRVRRVLGSLDTGRERRHPRRPPPRRGGAPRRHRCRVALLGGGARDLRRPASRAGAAQFRASCRG